MICNAVTAADILEMKADVLLEPRIEHTQQILPEFVATGAREAIASPNDAYTVQAGVLTTDHNREAFA